MENADSAPIRTTGSVVVVTRVTSCCTDGEVKGDIWPLYSVHYPTFVSDVFITSPSSLHASLLLALVRPLSLFLPSFVQPFLLSIICQPLPLLHLVPLNTPLPSLIPPSSSSLLTRLAAPVNEAQEIINPVLDSISAAR